MILQVILTILKIVGLILLVLVLLILALLLAVLFAPIRYHLLAAFTEEKKHGEVKISWLLHLISINAFIKLPPPSGNDETGDRGIAPEDADNPLAGLSDIQAGVKFRILGVDPAAVLAYIQKRKKKKAEKKRVRHKKKVQNIKAGKIEKTGQANTASQTEKTGQANTASQAEKTGQAKTVRQAEGTGQANTIRQAEGAGQANADRQAEGAGQANADRQAEGAGQANADRQTEKAGQTSTARQMKDPVRDQTPQQRGITDRFRAFCDKIKQIPNHIRRLVKRVKKLLRKPEQIKKKLSRFLRKIEKYEARDVLLDVWAQVKRLLHHFRVRKGSGYVRFGTGDPALTGELTGVLYLLLPASCGKLRIEPQFTDTMLDTELEVRGHIRLIHLVRFVWWAFFNKKLRRLIRAFRRK